MIKTIIISLCFIVSFYILILMSTSGAGVAQNSSRTVVTKHNLHAVSGSSSFNYGK